MSEIVNMMMTMMHTCFLFVSENRGPEKTAKAHLLKMMQRQWHVNESDVNAALKDLRDGDDLCCAMLRSYQHHFTLSCVCVYGHHDLRGQIES